MSRHSIESCAFQLHSWRPFLRIPSNIPEASVEPATSNHSGCGLSCISKRPCLSDRATSFHTNDFSSIDISKLSLSDEKAATACRTRRTLKMIDRRKRRRRGSRSVSGRSCSELSGTRHCRCVGTASVAAPQGACSDFMMAVGTDSSGEMFGNGGVGASAEPNWSSDVSDARNAKSSSKEREERESFGHNSFSNFDYAQGIESGYGSEPGYRGDGEFGYGDEVDEEEEDPGIPFWDNSIPFLDSNSKMEVVGENSFSDQKVHHRGRRKKA